MEQEYGDIIVIIVVSTITLLLLVTFIVLFLFAYQKRVYRHKRQMQKMQEEFKQELVSAKLELQEQVLNSVSEEMHDNLGQMLSVVKLNLIRLGRMETIDEKEGEVVSELKEQVSGVIEDVRNISKTLSQDFISNFGLLEALKLELSKISRAGDIETPLDIKGTHTLFLDGQSQIVIFRVMQEVINNAIKHSEASEIAVTINSLPDALNIEIADNGIGFNVKETTHPDGDNRGNGLRNMQNRMKIIGGVLNLESNIGEGTKVSIAIDTQSNLYKNSKN